MKKLHMPLVALVLAVSAPPLLAESVSAAPSAESSLAQSGQPSGAMTAAEEREIRIQQMIQGAIDLNRAKNLARMAAERENGGLSVYQAETAMHGPSEESPFVDNGDGTYTFSFMGGPPGFTTPTTESVVTVDTASWDINIDYNGKIR